jgi:hypothetical protein
LPSYKYPISNIKKNPNIDKNKKFLLENRKTGNSLSKAFKNYNASK